MISRSDCLVFAVVQHMVVCICFKFEERAYFIFPTTKDSMNACTHFFKKKPSSRPSTKSFLHFGHILVLKFL